MDFFTCHVYLGHVLIYVNDNKNEKKKIPLQKMNQSRASIPVFGQFINLTSVEFRL